VRAREPGLDIGALRPALTRCACSCAGPRARLGAPGLRCFRSRPGAPSRPLCVSVFVPADVLLRGLPWQQPPRRVTTRGAAGQVPGCASCSAERALRRARTGGMCWGTRELQARLPLVGSAVAAATGHQEGGAQSGPHKIPPTSRRQLQLQSASPPLSTPPANCATGSGGCRCYPANGPGCFLALCSCRGLIAGSMGGVGNPKFPVCSQQATSQAGRQDTAGGGPRTGLAQALAPTPSPAVAQDRAAVRKRRRERTGRGREPRRRRGQ
jgi:hypothetical protein